MALEQEHAKEIITDNRSITNTVRTRVDVAKLQACNLWMSVSVS